MKITARQLRAIIKEEVSRVMVEADMMKAIEQALSDNPEAAAALAAASPQEIDANLEAAEEKAEEVQKEAYLREAFFDMKKAKKIGDQAVRDAGGGLGAALGATATGAAGGMAALGGYAALGTLLDFLGNGDPMVLGDPLKWAAAAGALAAAGITGVMLKKAAQKVAAKEKAKSATQKESFDRLLRQYYRTA